MIKEQSEGKMKYKEKHSHQLRGAFGALALAMAMMIPAGCTNNNTKDNKKEAQGLLDSTPLKVNDKYNDAVTLYLVDVPVYDRNGERKKDQYMLTRGLQSSDYRAEGSKRYTRKAYFNNSNEAVYVQVDGNNAVWTERGFVGLFVDNDSKVVVVSDKRVSDFIKDRSVVENHHSSSMSVSERISKVRSAIEETDSVNNVSVPDSISTDTVKMQTDTLNIKEPVDTNTMLPDTIGTMRQDVRE